MTTKPPSAVRSAPEDSLESIAYRSVSGIPAEDPHDLDRLGFNVWLWMKSRRDPLEVAVANAGARLQVSTEEALRRIRESLGSAGVDLDRAK
jgi:hypothetical protein